MATFVNDLRLKEIATGDESGNWGNVTNTNLELIAEAFSFGTEAITTNADTHSTEIQDGGTDPGRSIFLKYTGTLDSACTITIGPNTVSKLWFIENATSGSQNIIISQGSGANITIANGQTKAIYSDGAGSGAAMVDAFQDLSIPDLFIDDDLTFTSDSAVITFGADGDTTLTHTDGSGLTLNSTNKLMFNDASQFIQGSSATVLSLGATDEIDLTATAIDVNGTMDVSGAITSSAGATITVADNSDVLTLVSTDADANPGPILSLYRNSASPADADSTGRINFQAENSAGETITYSQIFSSVLDVTDGTEDGRYKVGTMVAGSFDSRMDMTNTETVFNEDSVDLDFRVESNGNANMLFVDGGNDYVSIKTGSSINGGTLSVAGSIAFDGQSVNTYNDASGWIDFTSTSDTNLMRLHSGGDSGESSQIEISTVVSGSQSDAITVESGGTIVINQDSNAARDFRVESDSLANMFVVDSGDNRVFIGKNANTSFDAYGSAIMMQLEAAGTSPYAGFGMVQNSNDADSAVLIFGKSRGTSVASTTIVQDDDVLGRIEFQGMDGGDLESGARIMGSVDGTPGGDDMPGRLTFATTPDGANTPAERMRLDKHAQLTLTGTGSGFIPPVEETLGGYNNQFNAGAFSVLHRDEFDSYILGNCYFFNPSGSDGTAFYTKYGSRKANIISMLDGRINFQASDTAASANAITVNLSTRASIDSDGLKFGTDTAAANALNDYEEGTFTGVGSAGSSTALTIDNEKYTKIGNQVTIVFTVNFSGSSGTLSVSGLPFAVAEASVGIGREDATSGYAVYGRASQSSSQIFLFFAGATGNASPFQVSAGNMRFSMTYLTT